MIQDTNSPLVFKCSEKIIFIFELQNYKNHCRKRPILEDKSFLAKIQETLCNPHIISKGPKKKIRNYYKVFKAPESDKKGPIRYYIKIPTIKLYNKSIVKTAIDSWALGSYIVNPLEEIIWKNQNSPI